MTQDNIDQDEINKFEALAPRWWDPHSEFKPLHAINPLRLDYIEQRSPLAGKRVLDVGCGGGILAEAMAAKGATVYGIDMGEAPLEVAKLHLLESGLKVNYQRTTVEAFAELHGASEESRFDIITCMEMLEHVPDPESVITACRRLIKKEGHLYFSTINRNPKAWLFAIVGAEYLLHLLPKGTHDYDKFIRPSELERWCRHQQVAIDQISGMSYNPVNQRYSLGSNVEVNYLVHARPLPR
ncbi:MAG: bifunctional 2-polyprenyl-6-hydroxyphenol methylase/3-demethylubiquinol 3-O-methyltransferase UbiG [Gammaproteobacteria bacterium]|nr:bifunctional 2-polyprenyl-6-hydroxyphenol methylase/3-demethylubiquinol 3-O-methyltransferase UbiG [Gammaproteobacteria bacterium]